MSKTTLLINLCNTIIDAVSDRRFGIHRKIHAFLVGCHPYCKVVAETIIKII